MIAAEQAGTAGSAGGGLSRCAQGKLPPGLPLLPFVISLGKSTNRVGPCPESPPVHLSVCLAVVLSGCMLLPSCGSDSLSNIPTSLMQHIALYLTVCPPPPPSPSPADNAPQAAALRPALRELQACFRLVLASLPASRFGLQRPINQLDRYCYNLNSLSLPTIVDVMTHMPFMCILVIHNTAARSRPDRNSHGGTVTAAGSRLDSDSVSAMTHQTHSPTPTW